MSDNQFQYEYAFPAIKGVQAGVEYFVTMCPLKLIPKIFLFNEEEMLPEFRAQRLLNKQRIPEMAEYIVDNKRSYVFSAITASIDGQPHFEALDGAGAGENLGTLHISMASQFIINDGQHRRAAIEHALKSDPELGNETIAVVFFSDPGLKKCQQMFADLNRYAVRPSRSIGVLYDHRDEIAEVSRQLVTKLPFFRELVEMEKTTLAPRSKRLFTFSSIYGANKVLLLDLELELTDASKLAVEFWQNISDQISEWDLVRKRKITAGEVREDFIHTHGVILQAMGRAGNHLIKARPKEWQKDLCKIKGINWLRSDTSSWEGRALVNGRLSKSSRSIILSANKIKQFLNLPLTAEEARLEKELELLDG